MENTTVFKEIRQEQIYQFIKENKNVNVDQLVAALYASPATIRRDLIVLEKAGLIKRVHGGAMLVDSLSSEIAQDLRENDNSDKKVKIAYLMKKYISDNMSIFIDSSTTTRFVTKYLDNFDGITYITNSIKTANEIMTKKSAAIHFAGGQIAQNSNSTSGVLTIDFLNKFHADICIIGCRGISSTDGCTVVNSDQALIKQTMIKNSKKSFLLCDSTKFETTYFVSFAEFSDFDYLITDKMPEGKLLKEIQQSGCQIITYSEE